MRPITVVITGLLFSSFTFGQPIAPAAPSMSGQVSEKRLIDSSQQFADRIVQSKIPILVDFWAPWCGPCRFLGPTIEGLKKEYAGKILVMKINVDIHRGLANYFQISSIPAVFIIANKTVVEYLPGLQPKENYVQAIDKAIASSKKKQDNDSATKQTSAKQQPSGKASPEGKATPVADDE
jgi:thioredoxin 1